jgi:hypothetical protein
MKQYRITFLLLLTVISTTRAQISPFQIQLEPMQIQNLGGLQSFAVGHHGGKWLVAGGRLDGLHRRQPWAAFDVAGNNNQLLVIDPVTRQKWSAPLSSLPVSIQEQLSSTNMQFTQEGDYLYFVGGYGYHAATATRKTFDNLTAIQVPGLINAIVNGNPITPYFRQIANARFAVTGGHLKKINHTYYLVGGHRFDGNYNPMGNPTYTQVYTNAIRKFKLADDGINITITDLPTLTDATNLHRRDYNVVPQILPDGSEGLTAFSGVFRPNVDLPFLNCVHIDSNNYVVNNNFQQYYNHYHCAVLPLYSWASGEMHTVFFGGIAQYFDSLGILVQNNNVPFVKTIARVTRSASGSMAEYKLPIEMPGYLGAGSEFIPIPNLPQFRNDVIQLDSLHGDSTLVGYIFGGISSTGPNIFFTNTGNESQASSTIFKVFVKKTPATQVDKLNPQSMGGLQMISFPNPGSGQIKIRFSLQRIVPTWVTIQTIDGRKLDHLLLSGLQVGENIFEYTGGKKLPSGPLLVTLETPSEKATQRIFVK